MNERNWKMVGVSVVSAALLGIAACGSMKMPEMGQGIFGETSAQAASSGGSGVAVPDAGAQPMSQNQFQNLKTQVADEAMTTNKIAAVENAGRSAWFSAAQVGELATMIDMKGDRVRLVETVAERILDLNNPGAITTQLTFADERSSVETIMGDALAARQKEEARLAEAARLAEEKRVAEEQRRAEEQRAADEQARRDQAAQQSSNSSQTSSQTSSQSSSSSSAYCCLGEKYNACDSGPAAAACVGWGQCTVKCMMSGKSGCDAECTDQYPAIRGCQADASKDHLCRK